MSAVLRLLLTAFLFCALGTGHAVGKGFNGVVTHVTDGDSLWVRAPGGLSVQVRIHGVDAPEICQHFGKQARDALAARVLRRSVHVAAHAHDVYDRSVARVSINGQDLGAWLVAGGYAWSARYRNQPGLYATEEAHARQGRRGLWATGAVEPRLFRKRHGNCRALQETKP